MHGLAVSPLGFARSMGEGSLKLRMRFPPSTELTSKCKEALSNRRGSGESPRELFSVQKESG